MNIRSTANHLSNPQADDCLGLLGSVDIGSPLFYAIDFPELQPGQFAVCSLETSDGLTFPPDRQSYLDNENGSNGWQVFASFESARQQAIQNVLANPSAECVIYNAEGQQVHALRNGQSTPLQMLLASQPKPPRLWWQVWK